ncbi:S8 family serine peptidase, partial [Okeania sp. SIO3B5]|uniref:S8 family serine peptidase n=1 Tax=Okeania sp. SIO3B5 TaxID=2607811 RepID=UPI0025FF924B
MDNIEAAANLITSDSPLGIDLEDNNIEEMLGLAVQDPSGVGANGENQNENPVADNTPIVIEPLVLAEGQQVFDFDEISDTTSYELFGGQQIGDFFWSESWYASNKDYRPTTGYGYGNVSPLYSGFNGSANPVSITSEEDFTFNSAYLTAAWNIGLNIEVKGFNNGVEQYSETVTVNPFNPTLFNFDFIDVDEVQFTSFGGVDADPNDGGAGAHFVIDDLVYTPDEQELGSISGYKWNDQDGDGVWDDNEEGLEGWTIYIDENKNGELDEGEISTVTAQDGSYSFGDLSPGTYTIAEVLQPGWEQTYPSFGDEAEETAVRSSSSLSSSQVNSTEISGSSDTENLATDESEVSASDFNTNTTESNQDSEIPIEVAFASGQVIIKPSEDADVSSFNSLKASLGATTINTTKTEALGGIELWDIQGNVEDFISRNIYNSLLEYIEPNYIINLNATVPNDPSFGQLWGLNNTGQTGGTSDADIDAPEAWDIQTGSNNVVVGVIDTGIDYNHPDLADNMWTNPGEIAGNGIDDDGNGYVDDVYGYDFAYGDSDPLDVQSHGTHVAGTIAANGDNGQGVVGVNWEADLMALKFLNDSGSGSTFNAILAVEYATMMGADLTNNSWGGGGFSQGLYDAIAAAGAADSLFIAAAGNSNNNNDVSASYPASYDLDNIISVASTDRNDNKSGFSSYGATSVDLGAPGSSIYSTVPGGGYGSKSGTSMATPHVAGVAALVLAENPDLSYQEVKETILDTTDPISALDGITVTGGRLNAFNALSSLEQPEVPGTHTVELDTGENIIDINFGNRELTPETGSISGYKWNDVDGDGIWDDEEEGLAGWTIYIDDNGNGELDEGEISTVTDAEGYYEFDGLDAGTYVIAEELQDGWEQTYPGSGGGETIIIDFESLKHEDTGYQSHGFNYEEDGFALDNLSQSHPFATFGTLESRFSGSTALFNNTVNGITRLSAIDNQPFDLASIDLTELNGSNVADVTFVGELEGGGTVSQTFTLDGNAFDPETFVFNDDFNEVVSVEWIQESPFHQFDNITIETGSPSTHTVELEEGENQEDINFGNRELTPETGSISGYKWNDLDGNSEWDDGEPVLEGVTIYIDENENGELDDGELSTITDAEGYYEFDDLDAGTYVIGEIIPEGWKQTYPESVVPEEVETETSELSQSSIASEEGDQENREISLEAAFESGQVIVKRSEGADVSSFNSLKASLGATTIKTTKTEALGGLELWDIRGNVEDFISSNIDNSLLELIEPNYIINLNATVPNDPSFGQLWGLHNTGQTGGTSDADIDAPEAWDIQTGSNNVVVGVIDTGIDYTHPDLVNNMWTNPGEIAGNGIDDDGNGYVDDVYGYDFAYGDGDPLDLHSHGTHVAGTIAANGNNEQGIVGVNWDADLMAIKFLNDSGSGSTFNAILAVEYATMMGADLTNNSWGGGGYSQALSDAIAAAGAADSLFIAAAGNSNSNNDSSPHYPSSYDLDNVISVASTDHNDNKSSFSSYGATSVDLGAPGSNIYSTVPGGGYASFNGTSMATPHVAGVAALVLAENPDLSYQEVKEIIFESTDPISALDGITVTGGRLNAFNALSSLEQPEVPGTHTVELEAGENVTDVNFGNQEILSGSISGYSWNDLDGDGIKDENEEGLAGWTIYIDDNENGELDDGELSTVTDAEGYYEFDGLDAGTYVIAEELQDGWEQTYPASPSTQTVELENGEDLEDINFGNRELTPETGSISGYKWNDLNGNSEWDDGEPILEGVTIYIDENENGEFDEGEISTLTNAEGYYEFDDLDAGTYVIGEIIPEGWKQTYPDSVVPEEAEAETSELSQSSLSSEASEIEFEEGERESRESGIPLEAAFESGQVIVKRSEDADVSSFNSLKASLGATTIKTTKTEALGGMELWSIQGNVEDFISRTRNSTVLEYVERNYTINVDATVPNDPNFDQLWGLHNTGQTGGTSGADIDAPEAWDIQTGSNNVVVGVIDTGIDYTHPDLADNMWVNTGEIADNGIDDDGNGYVDDVYGYDFAYGDSDPLDVQSHGTHVAGTIAANGDDGQGIVGVNWDADLMAIKFLDDNGSGSLFNAILAIEYATMMGADLTNNSWGGGGFSQGLYDAIAAAGAADSLFVAAAGNSSNNNDVSASYPASYDLDNVISVASTDHNDNKSGFSNYGATSVDLGAPGSDIYSSIPGGGYASYSGTSMASPHVAGVAALVLAENPDLSYQEVKDIILETTDPISALDGITLTGGRLNAFNALSEVGVPGTHTVQLDAGENITDINFGNQEILPGSISGNNWHDLDEDGIWDDDEDALAGWKIYIDDNENGEFDDGELSTVTDENGFYIFEDLDPETSYIVAEVMEDGWEQTYPGTTSEVVFEADFSDDDGNPDLDGFTVDNTGAPNEGLWHLSTRRGDEAGHSGVDSMYYGIEETGDYDAGDTAGRIISPVIDLSGLDSAQLSFNYFLEVETSNSYDAATVLISENGGNFVPIASKAVELDNPTTGWTNATFDLSSYVGEEIEISFEFDTVDSIANQYEGWLVDDVIVETIGNAPYHTVEVGNGENVEDIDFGNRSLIPETGSISGYSWNDLDGDGIKDENEEGLEGWTIYIDDNENGELDDGELSTVTDAEGYYEFDELDAGTYVIAQELQDGWEQTYPGSPSTHTVELEQSEDLEDINFGNQEILPGSISGYSWNDLDGDGIKDENEEGLEGWTIYIDDNENGELDDGEISTVTDAEGYYEFDELDAGTYVIAQELQDGWEQTYPGSPSTHTVELEEGEDLEDINFGNQEILPGSISGYSWNDLNEDGIRDESEEGLEGWTIYIDDNENGELDEGEISTVTDAEGYYEFNELDAGTYVIAQELQDGWEQTYPGSPSTHTVELEEGEDLEDINFGNQEILPGSISGYSWNDLNEDGIRDESEEGLEGWTIYIDDNENGELDEGEISTVTDAEGYYEFNELDAGTYVIAQELQDGWEQTYP